MAIDRFELARELAELRRIALERSEGDPLPRGRACEERLLAEVAELDLHENITQLEVDGYTVLPPGKAAPLNLVERIQGAVQRVEEKRQGERFGVGSGLGSALFHLIPEDPAFEEALMAPAPLTLITYLLGYRAKLGQSTGLIKTSSAPALPLHADHSAARMFPAPWPRASNQANITWVLTDYTRDNGAVCVWPGSHRWGKPVPPELTMAHDREEIRVLEVPVGSLIVWHGSLWHGAVPRTAEGRRLTLVLAFVRHTIQAQEAYWASTTPEMLARNPSRFGTLMGLSSPMPWFQDGPLVETLAEFQEQTGSQFE